MTVARNQIATAVRYGNVIYARLTTDEDRQNFADLWVILEREVNTAAPLGDIHRIERVIANWRRAVAQEFPEAVRG